MDIALTSPAVSCATEYVEFWAAKSKERMLVPLNFICLAYLTMRRLEPWRPRESTALQKNFSWEGFFQDIRTVSPREYFW